MSILLGNARLFTLGEKNTFFERGAVLVENNKIKDFGESVDLKARYSGAEFYDLSGMLLMPGMINTHMHLYSTFARGMALKDEAPSNFVEILERIWWRLDKVLTSEDVYYSALIALMDCLKAGTTTVIDHHASPFACEGSLDQIEKAARDLGIRCSLSYEVSDRDGEDRIKAGIAENVRFIEKCSREPDELISSAFGLHASFTLSNETIEKCIEEAARLNSIFHVHVAEDNADVQDSWAKYKMPVLERLKEAGVLKVPTLAAHCVNLYPEENKLLKEPGVMVVHNPQSNMNNAVGCAMIPSMLNNGVMVGLGTDGFTSSMFSELKVMPLLHKHNSRDPREMNFSQIYQIAFLNNPVIAGKFFKDGLGEIKAGALADIIAIEYNPPTQLNGGNFLGHLIFGFGSLPVKLAMINGKVVLKDGKIPGLDEERALAKSRELAGRLWQRF